MGREACGTTGSARASGLGLKKGARLSANMNDTREDSTSLTREGTGEWHRRRCKEVRILFTSRLAIWALLHVIPTDGIHNMDLAWVALLCIDRQASICLILWRAGGAEWSLGFLLQWIDAQLALPVHFSKCCGSESQEPPLFFPIPSSSTNLSGLHQPP